MKTSEGLPCRAQERPTGVLIAEEDNLHVDVTSQPFRRDAIEDLSVGTVHGGEATDDKANPQASTTHGPGGMLPVVSFRE